MINNNIINKNNKELKEIIGINDSNINIYKFQDEKIKDNISKVFYGILFFNDNVCPKCNKVHNKFYVHNKKVSLIKLPMVSGFDAYLKLTKTRYKCMECNKTFIPANTLTNPGCFISNKVKYLIALKLTSMLTCTYIAQDHNVSTHTVFRVLDTYAEAAKSTTIKSYLPKVLHFDEFKSTKDADGNMSFVIMDGEKRKLLDIVENRQKAYLENYFSYYTKEAIDNVEYIVIDMYTPYIEIIKNVFTNAKIILDRFHIYQNLTRAFNKTRVAIMNADEKNRNKFKNFWKPILQLKENLSEVMFKHATFNYKFINNKAIINYLIENNEDFKNNYEIYQDLLFSLKYNNMEMFKKTIDQPNKLASDKIKTCISTFIKYYEYIKDSFDVEYNNGIIEGTISKFKKLKTISCGFRRFERLKTRIMIQELLIV
ncbi:ISL3 family transposase [Mycoplasma sp. P36-A1]|uniref:ISL3 family transposase n=1 Tax=Mycoplasma sp. P36-A1 TaxID=3252900 RepID=UPI003C2F33F0